MSAISEQERTAIYAALNVAGVTDLATGGVHFMIAAETTLEADGRTKIPAKAPLVVFNRIPKSRDFALGNNLVGEGNMWLIKAITDKDSSTTLEPPALAEQILTACETAIGGLLTLTGNINRMARRTMDIPNYIEPLGDREFYHHGFYLTTWTAVS